VRILLSSFEPFGSHEINASAEVARRLGGIGVEGAELAVIELPVVRYEAARRLVDAFERVRPDAAALLGIDNKRSSITPERVAVNVDDYRIPDNAGNLPADELIAPVGPTAYWSTLPIKAIVAALAASGIPAEVSNSAGTYLCNHVFYSLLHHIDVAGGRCRAGLVHIPQMREAFEGEGPSLPLETLVRGVSITIETVIATLRSDGVGEE
jgi:pyroglutamyl-peptidase